MNNKYASLAINFLAAIAFFSSAGYLAKYYFTFSDNNRKVVVQTQKKIYDRLSTRWLEPDVSRMMAELEILPLDTYDQLVFNTAMSRWRVKSIAPHAFDRLIHCFRRGLWNSKFVDDLEPTFKKLDEEWIDAREKVIIENKHKIIPRPNVLKRVGFILNFPNGTTTADIGSLIEVFVTAQPGSTPQQSVNAIWTTDQNPEMNRTRCRLCTFEDTKQTTAGMAVYKIRMDMADCPEWVCPQTRLATILFNPRAEPVEWTPVAYKFSDSPMLLIPKNNGPRYSQ